MSSDINLLNETKKVFETAAKMSSDVQSEVKRLGSKVDSYDQDKIDRMATDASKALEMSQQAVQKLEAQEKALKSLSASAVRPGIQGEQVLTVEDVEFKKAVNQYLRYNVPMQQDLVTSEINRYVEKTTMGDTRLKAKFANDLISGIDPDGGYFIMPDKAVEMITRQFETSPIRSIANVMTVSSNRIEFLIDDDQADTGGWVGEADDQENTTGTPDVGMLTIDVDKQFAQPRITTDLLADAAFDVESWLMGKVARRFNRIENTAFVIGNGSRKPSGFMNEIVYPAWSVNTPIDGASVGVYERGKLETLTTAAAGVVGLDDLTTLQNALLSDYRANATWVMHRLTWAQLLKISTTFDRPLIAFDYMSDGRPEMRLLGDRVVLASDTPLISTNALAIAYGDFNEGYTIVDRAGVFVLRDVYTKKSRVKFYTTKRVGGAVTSWDSLKRLKIQ